ncbi:hypothetical protein TNCV_1985021 [Trichonephila clavipes]|nr:hypothetical protein TNCV_1985021 [Trichonephila clavipes]
MLDASPCRDREKKTGKLFKRTQGMRLKSEVVKSGISRKIWKWDLEFVTKCRMGFENGNSLILMILFKTMEQNYEIFVLSSVLDNSRKDRYVTRMALMDRAATSRELSREFGSFARQQMSARTVRRRLQHYGLSARRPLPLLKLHYRQERSQWCKQ